MSDETTKRGLPRPPAVDRRSLLKGLGAASLVPLVPGCQPAPPADDDDSTAPPPGDPNDVVDTVVILMLENRSFDHYFGSLRLLEGRTDVDGLQAGMANPGTDGLPVEIHPADKSCVADPPHSWNGSRSQWNAGANDGFVTTHAASEGEEEAHRVMGYWTREKLTSLYALADAGVLCERWFCSILGPTWPNRFYSHAGQNGGERGNDFATEPFPSIYGRLTEAGVSWGGYYSNAPFLFLLPDVLPGENIKPIEQFFDDARYGFLPAVTIVEPTYGRNDDHPPAHPVAGEILIASVFQALAEGPHWERCLFVVTYDEHGGFFDHVPPPTAADDRAADGFDQLGFRVPTVVVGPYVRRGAVSSAVFDHTSLLAFLERRFGLEPLTARDAAANDMVELFDAERIGRREPLPPPTLPEIVADEAELYAEECLAGGLVRDTARAAGQPELEAFVQEHLGGTRFDRVAETDAVYQRCLDIARAQGVWRPSGR